jgi:hypothetical protein
MNEFELRVLPGLWKQALSGNVYSILISEINDYHQYAKQPDTGECFRRYYSQLEPLHSYLAYVTADCLLSESFGNSFTERIDKALRTFRVHNFFRVNHKIAVLKGTIDLAHGDVLIKQLRNLPSQCIKHTGLILIDYDAKTGLRLQEQLGINVLSLGSLPSLKDRYVLISFGIACAQYLSLNKEIIWWGIPFGMIFTYQLERLLHAKRLTTPSKPSLEAQTFEKSYLTVKHHHSFSKLYLDNVYSSTPLVQGFSDLYKPQIRTFQPSFYSKETLSGNTLSFKQAELNLIRLLTSRKEQGIRLISSASRIEKTCDKDYLSVIRDILGSLQSAAIVCFGKKIPTEYKQLVKEYGPSRIIFAGWCSPAATAYIIGLLDLFIDPFPFGAGMTFASAGYQEIPIVSTHEHVSSSPSSISILYSAYLNGAITLNSPALANWLFSAPSLMVENSIEILTNRKSFSSECAELRSVIEKVFVSPSNSVLACKLS